MGRYAWDLFSDPTYIRDRLRDEYADDALDAEMVELERRERERYEAEDVRLPLQPRRGT